ncbi:MAG: hypothetical protein IKE20_00520 [Eggerthellaceae bacterium]|nr:hypothetical protein [Eggerthellaceae bacterium]
MYRRIETKLWNDAKVEELGADARYLLLYLLTAPTGNLVGCYEITVARMSRDTDMPRDAVSDALSELCDAGIIEYRHETREVLLKNWARYNWTTSPHLMKPLVEGAESVKDPCFKAYLSDAIESTFDIPYGDCLDTVSVGCGHVSVSVTDTDTNKEGGMGGTKKAEQKHKHGTFSNVLLTDSELDQLKAKFPDWQRRIEDLSHYIGSTGKSYKSHYRTILSWARREQPKGVAVNAEWAKYR